jgi:hypothetical protein
MTTFFYWVFFTALHTEKNVQPKMLGPKELRLARKAETHQKSQDQNYGRADQKRETNQKSETRIAKTH